MAGRQLTWKRAEWWMATLLAIAAIVVTYFLTRPPELVWWTSPPIGDGGRHVRILAPAGWRAYLPYRETLSRHDTMYVCRISPRDGRPAWLRWLFRKRIEHEDADLVVGIYHYRKPVQLVAGTFATYEFPLTRSFSGKRPYAYRRKFVDQGNTLVTVDYVRADRSAFEESFKKVCESVRVE